MHYSSRHTRCGVYGTFSLHTGKYMRYIIHRAAVKMQEARRRAHYSEHVTDDKRYRVLHTLTNYTRNIAVFLISQATLTLI